MNDKIKKTLAEIYTLNPELKKHEKDLLKIIKEFTKNKPKTKFTKKFQEELKEQIEQKVLEIKEKKDNKATFSQILFKILAPITYTAVGVVLTIGICPYFDQKTEPIKETEAQKEEKVEAFSRSINIETEEFDDIAYDETEVIPEMAGFGDGGLGSGFENFNLVSNKTNSDTIEPAMYQAKEIKYTYNEDDIWLPKDPNQNIYITKSKLSTNSPILNIFADIPEINLSKFTNTTIRHLSLAQNNQKFGYIISLDFNSGIISINEDYENWPNPFIDCEDEYCYKSLQLKKSDMPSESEIITIANQFISDYQIDLNNYGEPIIDNSWKTYREDYAPETINIIYPLLINNHYVYHQNGANIGIQITINVRYKKVASVYGIRIVNFDIYTSKRAENALEKVANALKNKRNNYIDPYLSQENIITEEVELVSPEFCYVLYNNYETQNEIFIPAIAFTVKNKKNYIDNNKIIAPLFENKEIINKKTLKN